MSAHAATTRRIGLIGYGAIGRVVAAGLGDGSVPGATLCCVVDDRPVPCAAPARVSVDEAIELSDLIIEAAGQGALREHGRRILDAGVDLLAVSVGALADQELADSLLAPSRGRIYFTSGAIGGLDLLAASRALGPLDHVTLSTTKLPSTLVQPWMEESMIDRLLTATEAIEIYRGTASEVTARFPKSTNVAAALAFAIRSWEDVTVIVRADPHAAMTSHVIHASSRHGDYEFSIRNTPDESNPATSKVVPYAVLNTLSRVLGNSGQIL